MAKLHGIFYVIMGLFISISSYYIDYNKLIIFFYAGILFIGVGSAKLLLGLLKNKKEAEKTAHQRKIHHQSQHLQQHYTRCKKCGNVMRINDRFCIRCGLRV